MTMNIKNIKKYMVTGLATICMAFTFAASSEAAPHPNVHQPAHSVSMHNDHRHAMTVKHEKNDTIFFRYRLPAHHRECHNPKHSKWAQHFHCDNPHHRHAESRDLCRYDHCHNKHPFRH